MSLNYGYGILFMKTRIFEFPVDSYLIIELEHRGGKYTGVGS